MIGDKIKEARLNKEYTQEQLAKALNVSKQTVSNWETSAVEPTTQTIKSIARILNVTSDYILELKRTSDLDTEGLDQDTLFILQKMIDKIRKK